MNVSANPLDWLILDFVESTQSIASEIVTTGDRSTVPIVMTLNQTKGRGRFERSWYSEPGASLTLSWIAWDFPNHPQPWLIGMAMAVAAAGAVHAKLQWPNDLMLEDRKLGGILTEVATSISGNAIAVVGLGINLKSQDFPVDLRARAISLEDHRPGNYEADQVAIDVIDRLNLLPDPDQWHTLEQAWRLFDVTPGKRYSLPNGEEALAIGIGPEGELLCSVDGEARSVMAAEALIRPTGL